MGTSFIDRQYECARIGSQHTAVNSRKNLRRALNQGRAGTPRITTPASGNCDMVNRVIQCNHACSRSPVCIGCVGSEMAEISSLAQRLLQFSPDAMLVVDAQGMIQFSNETSSSLFGFTPPQLIGQPIKLLIPERFHARHGAHLSSYLRQPTSREMGARISDLFARRADGSEFPAGIRLSPFRDGNQNYRAAAIRDMTERRSISAALVAAREEADRANRAKSRFLATARHDLRPPLQALGLINAPTLKLPQ